MTMNYLKEKYNTQSNTEVAYLVMNMQVSSAYMRFCCLLYSKISII